MATTWSLLIPDNLGHRLKLVLDFRYSATCNSYYICEEWRCLYLLQCDLTAHAGMRQTICVLTHFRYSCHTTVNVFLNNYMRGLMKTGNISRQQPNIARLTWIICVGVTLSMLFLLIANAISFMLQCDNYPGIIPLLPSISLLPSI